MITKQLIGTILDQYTLPVGGIHGPVHWARVLENGLRLAEATGANVRVVQLFSVLHDSKRVNDGADFDHGQRAADFAAELCGRAFEISDHEFKLLYEACAAHELGYTDGDVTVRTCWDSDRLDLGRVGITPYIGKLCTDAAKDPDTLGWATKRIETYHVPKILRREWGIRL